MAEHTPKTNGDSLLITPITALQFADDILLAGEGPFLKVYNTSRKKQSLESSIQLFNHSIIHRITIGPQLDTSSYLVAVHGAKQCCVVTLDVKNARVTTIEKDEFSDWILAVAWLTENDNQLAIATAHNSVIRWDWKNRNIKEIVHCQEKCILYSALLIGSSWHHLVLAGGTVFNQVVIWDVMGKCDASGRKHVLHRLAGHQGVIFSITYNSAAQLLCSVSDDRSIRVWQVHFGQESHTSNPDSTEPCLASCTKTPTHVSPDSTLPVHTPQPTSHAASPDRLTPVCSDPDPSPVSLWGSARFHLLHVLYGHSARVWDARYLGNHLVSVGEDSTCCVWNSDGQVVQRFKGHRGKSIWSLAVRENSPLIATGGGDTGIRLWELEAGEKGTANFTMSRLTPSSNLISHDVTVLPKVTRLMNKDTVLVMTDAGMLFKYTISVQQWSVFMSDETFCSYSIMAVSPDGSLVAIGNIGGMVKLLTTGSKTETQCHDGKIFSLMWLSDSVLLTTGPGGQLILWRLLTDDAGRRSLVRWTGLSLPPARQRWVSAAELLAEDELLVCGDRVGSVHVYDLSQQANEDPIQSFWKVHGKAGVTDLRYHGNHVYSAGRDGEYRQYDVTQRRLELLHSNKVLKGLEWIARIRFTDDDIHVFGFFTDQFIMHSVGTNQTVLSLPCGGGHRAWDFALEEGTGDVTFVYIKAGHVEMYCTQLRSQHPVLKPSLHGREVTDAKLITTTRTSNSVCSIIATSSEDTRINIIGLKSFPGFPPEHFILMTLQGHISSVRCLATSMSNRCTSQRTDPLPHNQTKDKCVIVFSGGGRAQLKAWRIHATDRTALSEPPSGQSTKDSGEGLNIEQPAHESFPIGVQYEHLTTYNLHEKGRRNRKPWRKMTFDPCPETRYMSLSALPLTDLDPSGHPSLHFVAAACSDGFVRLMCFDEDERQFHVLAQSDFHDHCLLNTRLFTVINRRQTRLFLCSAGTGGRVVFWDITRLIQRYVDCFREQCCHYAEQADAATEPCLTDMTVDLLTPDLVVEEAHQSGVNALDLYAVTDEEYLLVTGGDDNCLSAHRLNFSNSEDYCTVSVIAKGKTTTAHAAQINAVHIEDPNTIYSVSIDQRLVTWSLTTDLQMKQAACRFVHVSDVSHMETWRVGHNLHALVTGVGLEYTVR